MARRQPTPSGRRHSALSHEWLLRPEAGRFRTPIDVGGSRSCRVPVMYRAARTQEGIVMVRFVHACRRLGLVAAGAAVVTVAGSLAPAVAMPGSATRAAAPSSSYRVIDLGTLPGASDSTALA